MCEVDVATGLWGESRVNGVSAAPAGSQMLSELEKEKACIHAARWMATLYSLHGAPRKQREEALHALRAATRKIVEDQQAKTSGLENGRADARAEPTQAQSRAPAPKFFGENTNRENAYRQCAECTSSGGRSSLVHNFDKGNVRPQQSHAKSHGVDSSEHGEPKFRGRSGVDWSAQG